MRPWTGFTGWWLVVGGWWLVVAILGPPRKETRMRLSRCVIVGAVVLSAVLMRPIDASMEQQCVDHSKDPAGCQPSTFDTPLAQMPSVRVNRQGQIDPTSSEADAKA